MIYPPLLHQFNRFKSRLWPPQHRLFIDGIDGWRVVASFIVGPSSFFVEVWGIRPIEHLINNSIIDPSSKDDNAVASLLPLRRCFPHEMLLGWFAILLVSGGNVEGRDAKKVGLTPPLDDILSGWCCIWIRWWWCDWWYVVTLELCMQEEECQQKQMGDNLRGVIGIHGNYAKKYYFCSS